MAVVSGGDRLEKYLEGLSKRVKSAAKLKVGFLAGGAYPDGTSVAMVAALQNFGTGSIPPRPFFSNMVREKSPNWGVQLADLLKRNDYDAAKALALMGEGVKAQLRQSIVDTFDPPLSEITLMLRKMKAEGEIITGASLGEAARRLAAGESPSGVSTKPLVDTGNLLASVDSEVT